jgi:hypothetical protein
MGVSEDNYLHNLSSTRESDDDDMYDDDDVYDEILAASTIADLGVLGATSRCTTPVVQPKFSSPTMTTQTVASQQQQQCDTMSGIRCKHHKPLMAPLLEMVHQQQAPSKLNEMYNLLLPTTKQKIKFRKAWIYSKVN